MTLDADYCFGGRHQRALRRAQRRATSWVTSSDNDRDRSTQTDMVRCVHCGAVWAWVRGSGNLRGWCCRCNGWFCGPLCEACVPMEQLLANMEAGLPFHLARQHRAVKVSVGGVLLGS